MIPGPNHPKKMGPQVALFTIVPLVFFIYCVQSVHAAICPWEVSSPFTQIDHPYEQHPAFKNQQYKFTSIQGEIKQSSTGQIGQAVQLMSHRPAQKGQTAADFQKRRLRVQKDILSRQKPNSYRYTGHLKNRKMLSPMRNTKGTVCRSSASMRFKPFQQKNKLRAKK